jgi:sugar phosphate isomerase/epimerase
LPIAAGTCLRATRKRQPCQEMALRWLEEEGHKDLVSTGGGVRYCLMGQGDVPFGEVLRLLTSGGYDGWIAFEWEKRWHLEIEEPEVALPDFVRVL